ncbi:unnamed protein product [Danaus chrysippus]|uniref:(African queen) hypothetical protein n=1 Tax=Danaus chrysippus TaxID=151541 RepID=A0A8J2R1H3_9NEOP|nr:unnamed protein product [Danaus chrysippus]
MIEVDDKPKQNRLYPSTVGEVSDLVGEDSVTSDEELKSGTMTKTLPQRQRKQPDRLGLMCTEQNKNYFTTEITFEEALQGLEREHWDQAVKEELKSFVDNSAWEEVDIPVNGNIVKCK